MGPPPPHAIRRPAASLDGRSTCSSACSHHRYGHYRCRYHYHHHHHAKSFSPSSPNPEPRPQPAPLPFSSLLGLCSPLLLPLALPFLSFLCLYFVCFVPLRTFSLALFVVSNLVDRPEPKPSSSLNARPQSGFVKVAVPIGCRLCPNNRCCGRRTRIPAMASAQAPTPKLDRYIVIHVATTCDEHGVYVTKDSAEVIELGWILLDAKTCEEVSVVIFHCIRKDMK